MKYGELEVSRNLTGKYHLGFPGTATTFCNHSGQGAAVRGKMSARPSNLVNAPEGAFCKKCFRNGPEAVKAAAQALLIEEG